METTRNLPQSSRDRKFRLPSMKIDPVVLAFIAIFAALAVYDASQVGKTLVFMGGSMGWIAPFFLLSIGVAAHAKASGAEHLIAKVFSGNPSRMIIAAAFFGALSPFCSCGVIPIIAGLLGAGVPLAPVMAFWLSSPLMDPEMFIISSAGLGLQFTIAKTLFAVMIGLIGGFATYFLQSRGSFQNAVLSSVGGGGCCSAKKSDPEVNWKFWREDSRRREFAHTLKDNGWFLGKWLTLAFLIESLMVAYIPASFISTYLGQDTWWTLPTAVLVGIPTYLNGFAAVPLMAELIQMGMMPGAAMAFMIAGGVTSIPAAIAVFALVRRAIFVWYIVLALATALLSGALYQMIAV